VIFARARQAVKGSTVRNKPDLRAAVALCWNCDSDLGRRHLLRMRLGVTRARSERPARSLTLESATGPNPIAPRGRSVGGQCKRARPKEAE
jgi:hypothetical protein